MQPSGGDYRFLVEVVLVCSVRGLGVDGFWQWSVDEREGLSKPFVVMRL